MRDSLRRRGFGFAAIAWLAVLAGVAISAVAAMAPVILPNGWVVVPPAGAFVQTGTMPQGMAASPDGSSIAVVESGYNPPALSLYRVPDLLRTTTVKLPGAFGRPLWIDDGHVLIAGGNADALIDVDVRSQSVARIALPKGSYPVFVARGMDGTIAVATDGDGAVRFGTLATVGSATAIAVGAHPGGLAFGTDGKAIYATSRTENMLVRIDVTNGATQRRATGLHPCSVAVANGKVYVAESDADALGIYDAQDLHSLARVSLADVGAPPPVVGVSPNAVVAQSGTVFVTLGAANSVAIVRADRLAGRVPAGWYPTDVLALGTTMYILDGKGEGARPNPNFRLQPESDRDYIGAIEFGSLRAYPLPGDGAAMRGNAQGAQGWDAAVPSTIVRKDGPISHVFLVVRENRTYDQILGDVRAGNGDPSLAWFGADVTPNAHALAARFGLFDNAYTSGEVSDPGHLWTDAAFANDYVERFWPIIYGGRRDLDDLSRSDGTRVPANGYLWEAARRAGVTFRDYGELTDPDKTFAGRWVADVPSLDGRVDQRYAGWNLRISDLDRAKEWQRDFGALVASGTLPQLELIWLPNDHTYGSKPGALTPASYVAINDDALGRMVETLSHSKVWGRSAMFVIEDDAQDGADHVSDQRTTLYVVSPYARGGVRHEHYATVGMLRTIEILLGMRPLSTYDSMAVPMYAAFTARPNASPYAAIPPKIDVTRRNAKVAYGAATSAHLDFSRPDAAPPGVLKNILAHNH